MRTLKEVYGQHPKKLAIRARLCGQLEASISTVYRTIDDGTIIGNEGVISLLFNEFGIKYDYSKGFCIDYFKLTEIENNTETTAAQKYGLS